MRGTMGALEDGRMEVRTVGGGTKTADNWHDGPGMC